MMTNTQENYAKKPLRVKYLGKKIFKGTGFVTIFLGYFDQVAFLSGYTDKLYVSKYQ